MLNSIRYSRFRVPRAVVFLFFIIPNGYLSSYAIQDNNVTHAQAAFFSLIETAKAIGGSLIPIFAVGLNSFRLSKIRTGIAIFHRITLRI